MSSFTEGVEIIGSEDEVQLIVQGTSSQTQALQRWQESDETVLAELREDGRLRVGGDLSLTAPSALVEANQTLTSVSIVKQGWQALGKLVGAIGESVAWIVHELRLEGSGGVTGVHTTLRTRLLNQHTGDVSAADLRSFQTEAINAAGTSEAPLGRLGGLQVEISNTAPAEETAHVDQTVGVEVSLANAADSYISEWVAVDLTSPLNNGSIITQYGLRVGDLAGASSNYAVYTGAGLVHLGDVVELEAVSEPTTPPSGILRLYAQSDGKVYAKNSSGEIFDLTATGSGGGSASDYVSIRVTNRSGATSQEGQVGALIYNGWRNTLIPFDYVPRRPVVALESVADGEPMRVAIFGRVTAIGDEAIAADTPLKLSLTTAGRLVAADYWNDHVVAVSVSSCSGSGETLTVDLYGSEVDTLIWKLGDPYLSRLGVSTRLG